jgi:hypothetical protein
MREIGMMWWFACLAYVIGADGTMKAWVLIDSRLSL